MTFASRSLAFPRPPRLRFGMATWFVVVSLIALVPMLAFSITLVLRKLDEQQTLAQYALGRRAGVAAEAIANDVASLRAELAVLARSDAALQGDQRALHAYAARVVDDDRRLQEIVLNESPHDPAFTTEVPYGAALPHKHDTAWQARLFASGESVVSPLVRDGDGTLAVGIATPVLSPHGLLALWGEMRLGALGAHLAAQAWPSDHRAAVVDGHHVIMARSHDAGRYVGLVVPESLREGLRSGRPSFRAHTMEGEEMHVSVARVKGTDWAVVVGRPVAALQAEVRHSVLLVLGAGLGCAALGIAAALVVARQLGAHLRFVVEDHADETRPGPLEIPSAVTEVDALTAALRNARLKAGRSADALHAARLDALTQVPGRALFLEQAQARMAHARDAADAGIALLFVDLDGFKQVNDRLGHDEGDRVLQRVALLLRQCVRQEDIVGRLGGDEFVICIGGSRGEIATVAGGAAQRIVAAVSALGHGLGCSVGLCIGQASDPLEDLLVAADHAMLAAKRAGKNRVVQAQ